MQNKKIIILLAVVFITVFALFACSAPADMYMGDHIPMPEEGAQAVPEDSADGNKIIYVVDVSVYCDNLVDAVAKTRTSIESDEWFLLEKVENGNALFIVRVRNDRLDSYVDELFEMGRLDSYTKQGTDVSLDYYQKVERIDILEEEKARLIVLLDTAEDAKTILEINSRLTVVAQELSSLRSSVGAYDSGIKYCTVNLRIYENNGGVVSKSLGQRMGDAFFGALNVLGWLLVVVVALSPFAVIALIIFIIVKIISKRVKERAAEHRKNMPQVNVPTGSVNNFAQFGRNQCNFPNANTPNNNTYGNNEPNKDNTVND